MSRKNSSGAEGEDFLSIDYEIEKVFPFHDIGALNTIKSRSG